MLSTHSSPQQFSALAAKLNGMPSSPDQATPILRAPQKPGCDFARPVAAVNGVSFVSVPRWNGVPWLWHGFSTRRGGLTRAYVSEEAPAELNLGFTAEDPRENVLGNRALFAEAITGHPATPLLTVRQIHSAIIVLAGQSGAGQAGAPVPEADGILTDRPGILVGIQTADCVPVLVADPKRRAAAAIHAGWRGTVKRIVENGVERMRLEFGSDPQDLIAAIGPAVGPCCYQVGEVLRSEFEAQFQYAPELFRQDRDREAGEPAGLFLDLFEANHRQLLAAGLQPGSIQLAGGCTACQPELFFSHRASRGRTGRMLSVIGIRPD
jgi:polyphenol oxidase